MTAKPCTYSHDWRLYCGGRRKQSTPIFRIKLADKLTALCPQKSAKLDGKKDGCTPAECEIDAFGNTVSEAAGREA